MNLSWSLKCLRAEAPLFCIAKGNTPVFTLSTQVNSNVNGANSHQFTFRENPASHK